MDKVNVNIADNNGNTPLIFACQHGNLEAVKKLVEAGADTNLKNNKGHSPEAFAFQNEETEIVKYLQGLQNSKFE